MTDPWEWYIQLHLVDLYGKLVGIDMPYVETMGNDLTHTASGLQVLRGKLIS